ncbi:M23 family metallopeptidase [Saccharothrix obliqua]|uniref:M23 family metallopeptidase n=1 Tax=Saccharothrix obliqua TaxID=2861747 RepID=UPI001C5F7577|nr:M23 family metallopeptidase [Saccharothrix obliqua]MBW4716703.1 M23 family metallopeptidase [Saccharothrix obliqua]
MSLLLALLLTTLPAPARVVHTWPLPPPHPVVRAFEPPPTPYGRGHRGVDLAAPENTEVLASADAVVAFAGRVGTRQLISLSHPNGLRTTYEPVVPLVKAGQPVTRGTRIGTLTPGHRGCRTPCLHWGAHKPKPPHREYLNPLNLLARVRLLPAS